MAIFNIRGTNGSGKSTVVRKLMKLYDGKIKRIVDKKGKLKHHKIDSEIGPIYLVGPYDGEGTGGCDKISKQDEVRKAVRKYAKKGHVIFEGFIVSGTYGRYEEMSKEFKDFKWVFLDTPQDVCIERVKGRRLRKGNKKPYDPKHLVIGFGATQRAKKKAEDAGLDVNVLRYKRPLKDLLKLLGLIAPKKKKKK